MWERCAGSHAERMRESRTAAESFLGHPDPNLRRAALMALRSHWGLGRDKDFAATCERLVFEDPDVEVRSLAIGFLSLCYSGSDDSHVGRLTAHLVVDDSAPRELRATAYRALIVIRGLPTRAFTAAFRSKSRFPEGVDWAFVDTFLDRGE
ncbi:MAG TPA: HEAT repeat domain-containing protein [Pirellulales bacterium]|nr:HEAT repeat domain-containing protein [Pirellulales bacterium]